MAKTEKTRAASPKYPDIYLNADVVGSNGWTGSSDYACAYPSPEEMYRDCDFDPGHVPAIVVYQAVAVIPPNATPTYPRNPL